MRNTILLLIIIFVSCETKERPTQPEWMATAPAGDQYTLINREGFTVIPNGRLITPAGSK